MGPGSVGTTAAPLPRPVEGGGGEDYLVLAGILSRWQAVLGLSLSLPHGGALPPGLAAGNSSQKLACFPYGDGEGQQPMRSSLGKSLTKHPHVRLYFLLHMWTY